MLDRFNPPAGALMTLMAESEDRFLKGERARIESEYFDRGVPKPKKQPYEQRVRARLAQRKVTR